MNKSELYLSQTSPVPLRRPRRNGRVGRPEREVRTRDLASSARDSPHFLRLRYTRPYKLYYGFLFYFKIFKVNQACSLPEWKYIRKEGLPYVAWTHVMYAFGTQTPLVTSSESVSSLHKELMPILDDRLKIIRNRNSTSLLNTWSCRPDKNVA